MDSAVYAMIYYDRKMVTGSMQHFLLNCGTFSTKWLFLQDPSRYIQEKCRFPECCMMLNIFLSEGKGGKVSVT